MTHKITNPDHPQKNNLLVDIRTFPTVSITHMHWATHNHGGQNKYSNHYLGGLLGGGGGTDLPLRVLDVVLRTLGDIFRGGDLRGGGGGGNWCRFL